MAKSDAARREKLSGSRAWDDAVAGRRHSIPLPQAMARRI